MVCCLSADHGDSTASDDSVVSSQYYVLMAMSSRRIALVIGTLVGLIAIVAWIAEIDLVFEESAEEQAPSQKSLVVEETSSREKAPAN